MTPKLALSEHRQPSSREIVADMQDAVFAARDWSKALLMMVEHPNADERQVALIRVAYKLIDNTNAIKERWDKLHEATKVNRPASGSGLLAAARSFRAALFVRHTIRSKVPAWHSATSCDKCDGRIVVLRKHGSPASRNDIYNGLWPGPYRFWR